MEPLSEVLESPALELGRIRVAEKLHRGGRRLRGTAFKNIAVRHLWRMRQRTPESVVRAYLRAAFGGVQMLSRVPGNPLLEVCNHITRLAARRGIRHHPEGICRDYLDGIRIVLEHALTLYEHGADAVVDSIRMDPPDLLHRVRESYGGCILCVAHNTGSVFSATRVSRIVPTVLVMRNSPSIERTRISLDLFERMGVRVLMARNASPLKLTRALLRVLRDRNVLVATVDRIDRQPTRVLRPFLGARVGLGAWAARIAVRAKAPIVPAYVTTARRRVVVHLGEPFLPDTIEEAMGGYLRHFEDWILRAPASWSFLSDRRWRWVLRDAVRGRADSDGGLVNPGRARRWG